MQEIQLSIPELLKNRAEQQPNDLAYTFLDYDVDPAGFPDTVTWSELYERVQAVAGQLLETGSPGDRAAILAPQGMDYIVAFLGPCMPVLSPFPCRSRHPAVWTSGS
jgi:long chain fatty acid CoA FadD26